MKRLNILQVFILAFTVTITAISCSKDNEEVLQSEQNYISTKEYEDKASFILKSIDKITQDSAKQNFKNLELNQETLDYYKDLLGLQEESVNLEMAEKIVGEVSSVLTDGIDHILERSEFSPYTTQKIQNLFSGQLLTGIEKEREFQSLILNEQKLLLTLNSIMTKSSEHILDQGKALSCSMNGEPAPCAAVGAIAGAVIGAAICGWPCAIGGAIIGGIAGGIAGGK